MSKHVIVLGGGLAGLACAYEAAKGGLDVTVIEREPHPGGMAASFEEGDPATAGEAGSDYWCHDFGPHRFHTNETELLGHVNEILGDNVVWNRRLSRICLMDRFVHYPLDLRNVLVTMPPGKIAAILLDYVRVRVLDALRLTDYRDRNFQEWVEKRFGAKLARLFFTEYTEKAWGIPATDISSAWASQRITLLSLTDTILKTVFKPRNVPRTLVTDFVYPRTGGIGQLARGYVREIEARGGRVLTGVTAIRLHHEGQRVTRVDATHGDESSSFVADEYISTIPITDLARRTLPRPEPAVRDALRGLNYISTLFVYLKLDREKVSDDHWIYLPEKRLTVHRLSEFKNFSPVAAPPGKTMVCCEITCRLGDDLWRMAPDELAEIAVRDLTTVGLIQGDEHLGHHVRRIPFSYPLYDLEYMESLEPVLAYVRGFENLQSGGRQGLFRYNNMDQSIEMGRRMAARLLGDAQADHEAVAAEQRYFG